MPVPATQALPSSGYAPVSSLTLRKTGILPIVAREFERSRLRRPKKPHFCAISTPSPTGRESTEWLAGAAVLIALVSGRKSLPTGNLKGTSGRMQRANPLQGFKPPTKTENIGSFPVVQNREFRLQQQRKRLRHQGSSLPCRVRSPGVRATSTAPDYLDPGISTSLKTSMRQRSSSCRPNFISASRYSGAR
jgi:hypothetical protein